MKAEVIVKALPKGRWFGSYGSTCCPAHDDHSPSLSVRYGDDGTILFKCHAGCKSADIVDALKERGLWRKAASEPYLPNPAHAQLLPKHGRESRDLNTEQRRKLALAMWKKAESPEKTPVETYLRGRGITCPIPPTIRYLATAKHSKTGLWLPCMIAGVTIWPSQEISGIHRTFLTLDGQKKAPVSSNKMMLGPCRGGSVRLAPEGPVLVLAEGIETGLSILQSTDLPVWACLSTSGLKALILPNTVEEVIIAADGDDAGKAAAAEAAGRFIQEGRKVRIAHPPAGMDFNDVLQLPENVTPFPMENHYA